MIRSMPFPAPSTPLSQTFDESSTQWADSLATLEMRMAAYRKLASQGASQAEIDEAAAQVAAASRALSSDSNSTLSTSPPTYNPYAPETLAPESPRLSRRLHKPTSHGPNTSTEHWRFFEEPAPKARSADGKYEKEAPMKRAGRGVLIMFATPLAAAGMSIYACGLILEGGAEMLKGIGSVGRSALISARGKRRRPSDIL